MTAKVTITFPVKPGEYNQVGTSAVDIHNLVVAILHGEADWPSSVKVTIETDATVSEREVII